MFLILQFRLRLAQYKVYTRIRQKGGMMIAAITTIIAAYDNNDSRTRYTLAHRAVIEKGGSEGAKGEWRGVD